MLKKIILLLFVFFSTLFLSVNAQDKAVWKNKKCAVVLTYDDALNVDLDNAIPLLDSLKFRATFYLSANFPGCRDRLADWKKAAQHGHELGNHTLFHPCTGNIHGREWVKPDYNLANYTIQRIRDEIQMNNVFLQALDGKTKRTFAYPCGDMKIGDSLYLDKKEFVAARGVASAMKKINEIDLYNVDAYGINGETGDQLIALVKKAIETNSLLVFLFHGVGGEHSLNVSLEAHRQLLRFLKQHEKEIWIAPFIEVTEFIKQHNNK